ncbi:hypothetical protein CIRMBP1230_00823 [Enterococcus cecorum]|nr:hypothetical protein CIRMBP1230_00823 [Enterococcus cecorum]CAI3359251.1 hypothetical protein CIRMBP1229_01038 [Enterococcus cecorum]
MPELCHFLLREEFVQSVYGFFCRIAPEDAAQSLYRQVAFPVVCTVGDIGNVLLQLFQDLFRVLQLLWREKGIVEDPVILLPVFVVIPQKIYGRLQQLQHPVAPLNAFGTFRNITSCQVCPSCINGIQELINAGTVLHLELVLHLVNDHFQAVCGIPVTAQELVRIMKPGIFFRCWKILSITLRHTDPLLPDFRLPHYPVFAGEDPAVRFPGDPSYASS